MSGPPDNPAAAVPTFPGMPRTVLVTGLSGNLGRALAKLLHTETHVVGVDRRPFLGKPKDIDHHQVDLRKARVEEVFRHTAVEAVIHMGIMHDPRMPFSEAHSFNVVGTQKILDLCVRHGVKKLVVLSSANVYGPRPDNSNFLVEETPLMAATGSRDVRDLIELDMLRAVVHVEAPGGRDRHPAPREHRRPHRPQCAVELPPAGGPRARSMGFDPMLQLIHEEDACRALVLALQPGVRGVYNVTGPGEVPLSAVMKELGRRPLALPHLLIRPILRRAFEARITSFPPEEVDHIQYLCVVDGSRFSREARWVPKYTLRETIRSVL